MGKGTESELGLLHTEKDGKSNPGIPSQGNYRIITKDFMTGATMNRTCTGTGGIDIIHY